MKIIKPNVELWQQDNKVAHVARCARVCYHKETGNDERLVENLKIRKHLSMFRHITYYYFIPHNCAPRWISSIFNVRELNIKPIGCDIDYHNGYFLFVINGQFYIEHPNLIRDINKYEVPDIDFSNANETVRNMMRYTFKVTTQISTSRELNRVSPNNISEQSTRYVYEDGTICAPHWMDVNQIIIPPEDKYYGYQTACGFAFETYHKLVDKGVSRQDARGCLPLDTATVCVYTYSVKEWRHILDLRYYGTTGKPHPNAKIIAKAIKEQLEKLRYEFRKETNDSR